MRERFDEKENMLSEFYNDLQTNASANPQTHPYFPACFPYPSPDYTRTILFIGGNFLAIVVLLQLFVWLRWVVAVCAIACMAAKVGNGWDRIELALHGDMMIDNKKRSLEKAE